VNNTLNVDVKSPKPEPDKFSVQEEDTRKILRALFDLTKKQIECFLIIRKCQNPSICVNHLVGLMESERSIVQKHMKVLFDKGLITRESKTLSEYSDLCSSQNQPENARQSYRGYLFVYNAISNKDLQEKVEMTLETWKLSCQEFLKSEFLSL